MNSPNQNIPFYLQMVSLLRNAVDLLDEEGQQEIFQFLESQQNADGGFMDRGGRSDLYYSLFGMLLLKAWSMGHGADPVEGQLSTEIKAKLTQFIKSQSSNQVPGFIEQCCLALEQKELRMSRISRIKTFIKLSFSFWKGRHSINLSYRSFVLFLTLDAVLPFRSILKIGAKKTLAQTTVDQYSPCSEVAAKVFLQKMMNQDASKDKELLKSFACETGGFKAFAHLNNADMLSTAVALFALNYAGCDLRLQKPVCLDFIEQNFSDGAFLSGDGDQTADVEYTFYGLLALGVLAS
jgi:hypothetical protein